MTKDSYRLKLEFKNGYGISVILNDMSYGLEAAALKDGEFTEIKGFTNEDGIMPYSTSDDVADLIEHLKNI